jgi:hypothetical protein
MPGGLSKQVSPSNTLFRGFCGTIIGIKRRLTGWAMSKNKQPFWQTEEQFNQILDALPVGVIVMDAGCFFSTITPVTFLIFRAKIPLWG